MVHGVSVLIVLTSSLHFCEVDVHIPGHVSCWSFESALWTPTFTSTPKMAPPTSTSFSMFSNDVFTSSARLIFRVLWHYLLESNRNFESTSSQLRSSCWEGLTSRLNSSWRSPPQSKKKCSDYKEFDHGSTIREIFVYLLKNKVLDVFKNQLKVSTISLKCHFKIW